MLCWLAACRVLHASLHLSCCCSSCCFLLYSGKIVFTKKNGVVCSLSHLTAQHHEQSCWSIASRQKRTNERTYKWMTDWLAATKTSIKKTNKQFFPVASTVKAATLQPQVGSLVYNTNKKQQIHLAKIFLALVFFLFWVFLLPAMWVAK